MKKLLSLMMVLMLVFGLAACSSPTPPATQNAAPEGQAQQPSGGEAPTQEAPADTGGLDIGIILPTREETRWLGDEANFKEIIAAEGLNAEILFSQNDSAMEKSNMETFISKGAKVVILCPFDAAAAVATTADAKKEGITVIAYDRLIMDTDTIDFYTTFDNMFTGRAMGQYLADQAGGRKGLNLYMYSGALTDNNSFIYFEGAWRVLQPLIADGTFIVRNCDIALKYKDKLDLTREEQFEILSTIDTEWDMQVSKTLAEAHLTSSGNEAKGEVFVLTPADDDCARALSDVFRADAGVTQWHITGADGVEGTVQYIIDGYQSMTVYHDTSVLCQASLDIAKAVIAGQAADTNAKVNNGVKDVPTVECPSTIVTRENIVQEFFDGGVYDGSKYKNWQ